MDKEREALEQQARVKGKKGYVLCTLFTTLNTQHSLETPDYYIGI